MSNLSTKKYKFESAFLDHEVVRKAKKEKQKRINKRIGLGMSAVFSVGTAVGAVKGVLPNSSEVKETRVPAETLLTKGVEISSDLKKENPELTKLPSYVTKSKALSGATIKTKEQAEVISHTNDVFFASNKEKPITYKTFLNGKAVGVQTKVRSFLSPIIDKYTKEYGIEGTEEIVLRMSLVAHQNNLALVNTDPMQIGKIDPKFKDLNDPNESVKQAVKRLADLLKENKDGDFLLTLQAYNMGGTNLINQAKKDGMDSVYNVKYVEEFAKKENVEGDIMYPAKSVSYFTLNPTEEKKVQDVISPTKEEKTQEEAKEKVETSAPEQKPAEPEVNTSSDEGKGKVVLIDPGHGGKDPGATNGPDTEADLTYQVAEKVEHKLEDKGVNVIMSRPKDGPYVGIDTRVNKAVAAHADAILSIHLNSASPSAAGVETWYSQKAAPGSNGYKLAQIVQKNAQKVLSDGDRGIASSAVNRHGRLGMLDNSSIPSSLVEIGFISNAKEKEAIKSEAKQDEYATALANSMMEYFVATGQIKEQTSTTAEKPVEQEKMSIADVEKKTMVYVKNAEKNKLEKVSLRDYLIGVVASEMPTKFNVEALKAQALAARTKIVSTMTDQVSKDTFQKDEDGKFVFNVENTVNFQAYKNKEELKTFFGTSNLEENDLYKKVVDAVDSTSGKIITYKGNPISALYYAASNGYSEDPSVVWGGDQAYLKAVDSRGEKAFEKQTFGEIDQTESAVKLSVKEIEKKLAIEIDKDDEGKIINLTPGKRVKVFMIGGKKFDGKEIREKLELKSTDFEFERKGNSFIIKTKGFGHGIGMSQIGAGLMASQNHTYDQILAHYYPGTDITDFSAYNDTMLNNDTLLNKANEN